MWEHNTRKKKFCLCVNDFGIKYFNKDNANHLLQAIGKNYRYTTDWERNNYCGLTLSCKYVEGYVDVSIPGYIEKSLIRL